MVTHLDYELQYLRELLLEMLELVYQQLQKVNEALMNADANLAEDIMRQELRVNALELTIEKQCVNVIALNQPVASYLRFVLTTFRSVSELERIADHAYRIAKNMDEDRKAYDPDLLVLIRIDKILALNLEMFRYIIEAMYDNHPDIARKVFKKDKEVDKLFRYAARLLSGEITQHPKKGKKVLITYSLAERMERIGDLLTNIAEAIIFYFEAEVIKHKKKNKKIKKRLGAPQPDKKAPELPDSEVPETE